MLILELVRRIGALGLIVLGLYFVVWPGPQVLVVKPVDFVASLAREPFSRGRSLARYIAYKTEGRVLVLDDARWSRLAARIHNKDQSLAGQQYSTRSSGYVFSPETPPFSSYELAGFQYVQDPASDQWFSLTRDYPQELYGLSDQYLYPYRLHGLALMVAGMLVFFVLPRKRYPDGYLQHGRGASVVAPDCLGLLVASVFAVLPVSILLHTRPQALLAPMDGGWVWLLVMFWGMALGGLMLLGVGVRYSFLAYRLTDAGLEVHTWTGCHTIGWPQMNGWKEYEKSTSRVLGRLLLFFGNTLALQGVGLSVMGNTEQGIRLTYAAADGRNNVESIMSNHFPGYGELLNALRQHNIPRVGA